MAGLGPGQVVLCHIRKQVEQAVGRKAVSRIPLVKAKAQLVGVIAGFSPASVAVSCDGKISAC